MAYTLATPFPPQYEDSGGIPEAGGSIEFYVAGTSTPTPIYFDNAGLSSANTVDLDTLGMPVNSGTRVGLYFDDSFIYDLVLKDSDGGTIQTISNFAPVNAVTPLSLGMQIEPVTIASDGQTTITLTTFNYTPGANELWVFRNGTRVEITTDYIEASVSTITWNGDGDLSAGDEFVFVKFPSVQINTALASNTSYSPAGTGAVTTNVETKLREFPTAGDFATAGDGVTNDTTEIQAHLDVSESRKTITAGNYLIDSISIPIAVKHLLVDGYFIANTDAVRVVSTPSDTGRGRNKRYQGIHVDGNGLATVTGFFVSSQTDSPSPGAYEATLYLDIADLYVEDCAVGFDANMSMEMKLSASTLINNDVGFKMYSDSVNGGGNANNFTEVHFQGNVVGMMLATKAAFEMQHNKFTNCVIQENTLCGAYINGTTGPINTLVYDNCHFETNASAGTTAAYQGYTVTRCGIQLEGSATVTLKDCTIQDTYNPWAILANGATLHLDNVIGFGGGSGDFATVDSTSKIYEQGKIGLAGYRKIESFGELANAASCLVNGPAIETIKRFENHATLSNNLACTPNPTGVVASGETMEGSAPYRTVGYVQFQNSAGSTGTNNNYWTGPTGSIGDYVLVSVWVRTTVSTNMRFYYLCNGALRSKIIPLDLEWRRVVLIEQVNATNAIEFYTYPEDTAGATIQYRGLQILRTTDFNLISECYHKGIVGLPDPYRAETRAAAPTGFPGQIGQAIYNASPSVDGNNMVLDHWLCTVTGDPATWVAQYISTVTPAT